MSDLRFQIDKLEFSGTPEKKDILVMKFLDEGNTQQIKSLQAEIQSLKNEAGMENVVFLMLPPHIHLMKLSDEDLDSIGLVRK
jgi:hypothetical protein